MQSKPILEKLIRSGYFVSRIPWMILSPFRKEADFLIVGTQKGGTSTLHHLLDQHPHTYLPQKKELHYFSKYYAFGRMWYKSFFHFKWNKKITGEATPNYMFYTEVAERIYKFNPGTKIIILLRDPTDRALSQYFMELNRKKINREFEKMVKEQLKKKELSINKITYKNHHEEILQRGRYYSQIKNWLNYFPRKQLLILKSEEFFRQPKETLKKVYDFLELSEVYPDKLEAKNIGQYKNAKIPHELKELLYTYYQKEYNDLYNLAGIKFDTER